MKKSALIFSLVFVLTSCHKKRESFISFEELQPLGVEEIQEVPENWIGNYRAIDSSIISIEKDKIIEKGFTDESISIHEKDSLPGLTFENNFVIDNVTKQKMKLVTKNDTLFWKSQDSDTIFIKDKVLKYYKDALIVNTSNEGKIYIDVFKKENNQIREFSIDSKDDFEKLKREIKINFEYNYSDTDTTVVVKPTRADFRKILRKKGFKNELIFNEL